MPTSSTFLPPRQHHVDFNVQKMEDIYRNARGKNVFPHRHDYYTVLFVINADGEHVIDYKAFRLAKNQVFFVSPGQVHQVKLNALPKGWVVTFTRDFLTENDISEEFILNVNLFQPYGDSPPVFLDEISTQRLVNTIQEMEACLPQPLLYRDRALGALLQLFLIYTNQCCALISNNAHEPESNEVCILRDFKQLVDLHFTQWHKVNQYAEALYITPKHLSNTVKLTTGKTAKQLIQNRLMLEAKRLLLHTNQSVKEIAYHLGFEEPLHFSAFFKKGLNQSPSNYRAKKGKG